MARVTARAARTGTRVDAQHPSPDSPPSCLREGHRYLVAQWAAAVMSGASERAGGDRRAATDVVRQQPRMMLRRRAYRPTARAARSVANASRAAAAVAPAPRSPRSPPASPDGRGDGVDRRARQAGSVSPVARRGPGDRGCGRRNAADLAVQGVIAKRPTALGRPLALPIGPMGTPPKSMIVCARAWQS